MGLVPLRPQHGEFWKYTEDGQDCVVMIYYDHCKGKLMRTIFGPWPAMEVTEDIVNGQNGWLRVVPSVE